MRSDVYVTVRRHRPLRPVDVLNPVMMTYWVMRFVLWLLMVGMMVMVIGMVALVHLIWRAAVWIYDNRVGQPHPAHFDTLPVDGTAWTEPEWTHAEVLDRLPPHIADDFREKATSRHFPDGTVIQAWGEDIQELAALTHVPTIVWEEDASRRRAEAYWRAEKARQIAAESRHFTDGTTLVTWGEELPYGSYSDGGVRPTLISDLRRPNPWDQR